MFINLFLVSKSEEFNECVGYPGTYVYYADDNQDLVPAFSPGVSH